MYLCKTMGCDRKFVMLFLLTRSCSANKKLNAKDFVVYPANLINLVLESESVLVYLGGNFDRTSP